MRAAPFTEKWEVLLNSRLKSMAALTIKVPLLFKIQRGVENTIMYVSGPISNDSSKLPFRRSPEAKNGNKLFPSEL